MGFFTFVHWYKVVLSEIISDCEGQVIEGIVLKAQTVILPLSSSKGNLERLVRMCARERKGEGARETE